LLIQGPSAVGKSYAFERVGKQLAPIPVRGFYSLSIWSRRPGEGERGHRLGWCVEAFDGSDGGMMLHRNIGSVPSMGPYGVDRALFTRIVEAQLTRIDAAAVYFIDEIGTYADWAPDFEWRFEQLVSALLDSPARVVAIVRLHSTEGFPQRARERDDVELWDVTLDDRDTLAVRMLDWIMTPR
jgi:nucleoside-triphosphatase THEP1